MTKMGTGSSWPFHNWEFVRSMWTDLPPATFYLGAKGLSYILKIAREIGQPCPLATLTYGLQKKQHERRTAWQNCRTIVASSIPT